MADLPAEHVDPSPPFSYCGMDCFGPFNTKQGQSVRKRYSLLFTCFSSRAIHTEMIDDMSTYKWIMLFHCFTWSSAAAQIRSRKQLPGSQKRAEGSFKAG